MDYRDKILQIVRYRPQLPSAVAKGLGVNTIIAGAMLSEMVSKRILRISNLKIGSSPLYYLPDNEALLEEFKDSLDRKNLDTFELLKEKRVLREVDQSPLTRVCLKNLKDFSKPLEVQYDGKTELFFKWFLLSDDQAKEIISEILNPKKLVVEKHEAPVDQALREKIEREARSQKTDAPDTTSVAKPSIDETKPIAEIHKEVVKEAVEKAVVTKDVKKKDKPSPVPKTETKPKDEPKSTTKGEEQQPLTTTHLADDDLVRDVAEYCKDNKIGILWHEVKRKGAECHFEITIPSPVGRLTYFAFAKSKKRVNDTDLSQAYVAGQLRKLPVVFLSRGELSKKAAELLKDLKGITFATL